MAKVSVLDKIIKDNNATTTKKTTSAATTLSPSRRVVNVTTGQGLNGTPTPVTTTQSKTQVASNATVKAPVDDSGSKKTVAPSSTPHTVTVTTDKTGSTYTGIPAAQPIVGLADLANLYNAVASQAQGKGGVTNIATVNKPVAPTVADVSKIASQNNNVVVNDPNYWSNAYNNAPAQEAIPAVATPAPETTKNTGNTGGTGGGSSGGSSGGSKTPSSSGGTSATSTPVVQTPAAPVMPTLDPVSDEAYQNALAALKRVQGNAPVYNNTYLDQLTEAYNNIVNRNPFTYDAYADPLYRDYAQIYANNGRLAMKDTMGQAAGLTGGYGSTYSQSVGQQQYNRYMQDLNGIVPELYDRAYKVWQDEGDRLTSEYSVLQGLADDEYNKFSDDYKRWQQDRDYATDVANDEYTKLQNAQADAQKKYDKALEDYEQKMAEWQNLYGNAGSGGGSGGGSGSKSGGSGLSQSKPNTYTVADIQQAKKDGLTKQQVEELLAYNGVNVKDSNVQNTLLSVYPSSYNMDDLLLMSSAASTKASMENEMRKRGLDPNDPKVQADILYAMRK